MRASKYLLSTFKEIPNNTETISHKLMLRAGIVRQVSSGIYVWLPTGLRVLNKIINIIRVEMNNIGALEIVMPIMQPIYLWEKSKRLLEYGLELFHLRDRYNKLFVLGPTYEEMITHFIRHEIRSYKQLPLIIYQINNKFRDEIRPRFGIIRSREFIMKDAYSFHIDKDSLQLTYDFMYQAYSNIFKSFDLKFSVIQADSGSIGGNISHEFQVLASSGENDIVLSNNSSYAAHMDLAVDLLPDFIRDAPREKMYLKNIPNICNIFDLIRSCKYSIKKIVKIYIINIKKNVNFPYVALMVRGDHELNFIKIMKLLQITSPITYVNFNEVSLFLNKFDNPIQLMNLPLIIDRYVAVMSDFIIPSAVKGKFFFGVNWCRDFPLPKIADLRKVKDGDLSPDGKGILKIQRGIEVGHIFQLGEKYSRIMQVNVQDNTGSKKNLLMGCYGIGVTRLVSAIIEQNYDKYGIIWPAVIAPFLIVILPIDMYRYFCVKDFAENIYLQLKKYNIDVIIDDREERPGVMFADFELIGIPHILIINNSSLNRNKVEYKDRRNGQVQLIDTNLLMDFLIKKLL